MDVSWAVSVLCLAHALALVDYEGMCVVKAILESICWPTHRPPCIDVRFWCRFPCHFFAFCRPLVGKKPKICV
jgi:hypothetical protein